MGKNKKRFVHLAGAAAAAQEPDSDADKSTTKESEQPRQLRPTIPVTVTPTPSPVSMSLSPVSTPPEGGSTSPSSVTPLTPSSPDVRSHSVKLFASPVVPPSVPVEASFSAGSVPPSVPAEASFSAGSVPPSVPVEASFLAGSVPPSVPVEASFSAGSVPPSVPVEASFSAGSVPPSVPAEASFSAGSVPPSVPAEASFSAGSVPPSVSADASFLAGSVPPSVSADASFSAGSAPPSVPQKPKTISPAIHVFVPPAEQPSSAVVYPQPATQPKATVAFAGITPAATILDGPPYPVQYPQYTPQGQYPPPPSYYSQYPGNYPPESYQYPTPVYPPPIYAAPQEVPKAQLDVISRLTPEQQNTIRELQQLHQEYSTLNDHLTAEILTLRASYEEKFKSLYNLRAATLQKTKGESTQAEGAASGGATETEKKEEGAAAKTGTPALPGFWLQTMKENRVLHAMIEPYDEPVLEYLRDIQYEWTDVMKQESFKISFYFAENPYFSHTVLEKQYNMGIPEGDTESMLLNTVSTSIKWAEKKDVTRTIVNRKQRNKRTNSVRTVTEIENNESFFSIFETQQIPTEAQLESMSSEEVSELELILESDYETGVALRDMVIPRAVQWFLRKEKEEEEVEESSESSSEEDEAEQPAVSRMSSLKSWFM